MAKKRVKKTAIYPKKCIFAKEIEKWEVRGERQLTTN